MLTPPLGLGKLPALLLLCLVLSYVPRAWAGGGRESASTLSDSGQLLALFSLPLLLFFSLSLLSVDAFSQRCPAPAGSNLLPPLIKQKWMETAKCTNIKCKMDDEGGCTTRRIT